MKRVWYSEMRDIEAVENSTRTHTLTEEEKQILRAMPIDDIDRSEIKWRKVKKWKLSRNKKFMKPKKHIHPGTDIAREVLKAAGIPLNLCQECDLKDFKMTVHHVDGNPYNNSLDNLRVLCAYCHGSHHNIVGLKGVKAWYYGTIPDF